MTNEPSPTSWSSAVLSGLLAIALALVILFLAPRKSAGVTDKKILKHHTIRIDEIPSDKPHEALQDDLEALLDYDTYLKEGVHRVVYHFLGPRNRNIACATATYHTSISANDLATKLTRAATRHSYRFDAHFRGITPLCESPSGADVDIVAVPGLSSHAVGSWKSPGGQEVWLRDFLPCDLERIRVLLYGYDTPLLGSDSKDSIEDLGKRFLETVKAFRKDTATDRRPIVFIGHSLGGLLIKEALIHAHNRSDDSQNDCLRRACYGLLFFGVPNLGLRHEQLSTIVRGKPNELLIRDLVVGNDSEPSPFLKRVSSEFSRCCKGEYQYKVVSFFERNLSPTVQIQPDGTLSRTGSKLLLVTEKSATSTGLTAAADENNIPLSTDHTGLVKFEGRSQSDYSIVKGKLETLVSEAKAHVGKRYVEAYADGQLDGDVAVPLDDITKECLKSLAFPEMDGRPNDIDPAADGTCNWLLDHNAYKTWSSADRGLLWIKGKPGSGKSTLLRYALEHSMKGPIARNRAAIASFFFHGRGTGLQRTALGLFRSVLHQVLRQDPNAMWDLVAVFRQRRETVGKPGEKWQWHEKELQALFKTSVLKVLKHRPMLLFVDALDEGGEKNAVNLVKEFKSLLQETSSVARLHICFTCRHYPILGGNCEFEVCLEDENADDISTYVQAQLSANPCLTESTIPAMITGRANGVFMWARLVVQKAAGLDDRGESLATIETSIRSSPPELEELYENLVKDMDDTEASMKLIQWICFSTRPMSLDEMRWAMTVEIDCLHNTLKEYQSMGHYIRDNVRMEKKLKTLSRGLAEVVTTSDAPIIQFIHQSVKEFFVAKGLLALDASLNKNSNGANSAGSVVGIAHYRLARICVRYMTLEEISQLTEGDPATLPREFDFLAYATESWVVHVQECEAKKIPQDGSLGFSWPSESFITQWVRIYGILAQHELDCPPDGTTWIHLVARYQLLGPLQVILGRDDGKLNIDARDNDGRTPLSYAAENGREAVVEMLLKTGKVFLDAKDIYGYTPLWYAILNAANSSITTIVKMLLETGKVDVNAKDDYDCTPLAYAAENGHAAVIKVLLDAGKTDIDAKDSDGRTPFSYAAENGHAAVVKVLLDTGKVDIDAKDSDGCTPFFYAAENGHAAVVKVLLDTGKVDIDAKDSDGCTPFSYAAENGHAVVAKMLLETSKVDIDAKDSDGRTPLSSAADNGHAAVVKMLLETGKVDIDPKDKDGRSPFLYAAWGGHEASVKMLLETGKVDVDAQDDYGQSPLLLAAACGHEAVVKVLLDAGKPDIDAKDSDGRTLFLYAARFGHAGVAKMLLDTGKVDIDGKDNDGRTLLSYAAENGHAAVVKVLLETGKVDAEAKDSDGRTPFFYAAENGHAAVVKVLLDTGKVDIDAKDSDGCTPFFYAAENGHAAVVKVLLDTGKVKIDAKDHYSGTPFFYAALSGNETVVKMLLESGKVDIDAKDNYDRTPFSYAAGRGNEAVVKMLLETGKVDIDTKDNDGRTPFSYAAERGDEAVVKMLLETGKVDIDTKNNYGRTPFSYAARSGKEAVVTLLLDWGAEVDTKDVRGRTPLSWAASQGQEATTSRLLRDPRTDHSSKDDRGRTPLLWAVRNGHDTITRLLLSAGALATSEDDFGTTALMLAVTKEHKTVVEILLDNGADVEGSKNSGWNALQQAASNADKEVEQLLQSRGAYEPDDFFGIKKLFSGNSFEE